MTAPFGAAAGDLWSDRNISPRISLRAPVRRPVPSGQSTCTVLGAIGGGLSTYGRSKPAA